MQFNHKLSKILKPRKLSLLLKLTSLKLFEDILVTFYKLLYFAKLKTSKPLDEKLK